MRTVVRGALAAATLAALSVTASGCTIGPAANRAERAGVAETPPPSDPGGNVPATPDGEGEPAETGDPGASPTAEPVPPAPAEGSAQITGTLAGDLAGPCCAAALPDGGLLVGSATSPEIRHVAADGTVTSLGEVPRAATLRGLAVPPDFTTTDGYVYVAYSTETGEDDRVARVRVTDGRLGTVPDRLVQDLPPGSGAALAFGPDGMLYVGTGDGGQPALAADAASPAGKILRMAPDGGVPADNPEAGSLVYSRGHSAVRGLAWDAVGRLWAVDGTDLEPIAPGGSDDDLPAVHSWPATVVPAGLAYAAGSLWLADADPSAPAVWRAPLDGTALVADPQPLLRGTLTGAPAALVPGADDATLSLVTSGAGGAWLGLRVS